MKSHLFILFLMSLALGDILVKILLHVISEMFLPIISGFYKGKAKGDNIVTQRRQHKDEDRVK